MKKHLVILVACAAFLFGAAPAQSTDFGPYIGAMIGGVWMSDSDIKGAQGNPSIEYDRGYALGVAAGYAFMFARFEAEIAYQKNDMDKVSWVGQAPTPVKGDVTNLSFLVNGYYDFTNHTAITPYVGAGLGFARVSVGTLSIPATAQVQPSDDDNVLAYQIGAGVGVALSRELTLDFKYRYYGTQNVKFNQDKLENRSHNFFIGIRHSF